MFNWKKSNISKSPGTEPMIEEEYYPEENALVEYDPNRPELISNPEELRVQSIERLKNQSMHERNMAQWRRDNKERLLDQARTEGRLEKQHEQNADAFDVAIHALTAGRDMEDME